MKKAIAVIVAVMMIFASVMMLLIISNQHETRDDLGDMDIIKGDAGAGIMASFDDHSSLQSYLSVTDQSGQNKGNANGFGGTLMSGGASPTSSQFSSGSGGTSYSDTNVQVQGVDEEDFVKTDGEYIYLASGVQVSIIKAYPVSQLEHVSSIDTSASMHSIADYMSYSSIDGIFIHGDFLITLCTGYRNEQHWVHENQNLTDDSWMFSGTITMVLIYDISDKTNPILRYAYGISGWTYSSRMIDSTVYIVTSSYITKRNDTYNMPTLWTVGKRWLMEPDRIVYDNDLNRSYSYLNVLAIDIDDNKIGYVSMVADWSSCMYMSLDNLYITYGHGWWWWGPNDQTTKIFKISADDAHVQVVAKGEVKGNIRSQFSMDEKVGNLRVVTTERSNGTISNNVYVLDRSLNLIGSLEGIAPNETSFATRFMEDRLYLVTFRYIDPFIVIDLSDPNNPTKLGELEIPGFSTYLHPIDDTHVLGIGRETGSVAKLTLFDVTDPLNPTEVDTYLFLGEGNHSYSYTQAEYDHKAVCYDSERHMLAIPISIYSYSSDGHYYNSTSIQGVAVLDISTTDGISLRGIVEHNNSYASRALYIGDYLYTLGYNEIKVSNLSDLSSVDRLVLDRGDYYGWYY